MWTTSAKWMGKHQSGSESEKRNRQRDRQGNDVSLDELERDQKSTNFEKFDSRSTALPVTIGKGGEGGDSLCTVRYTW